MILPVDLEPLPEQKFALGLQIDQDLFKVIYDLTTVQGTQLILGVPFGDDMWRTVLQSGSL